MTCATCLHRSTCARRFYPRRRPLYVRCGNCKMRRRARRYVASRILAVAFGAVTAIVVVLAAAGRMWR